MNWLDRTYRGQTRLWRVFWFGFALPLLPLTAAIGVVKEARPPDGVVFSLFLLLLIYQAWLAVVLWRCAPNTDRPLWRRLARILAVVLGLLTLTAALQQLQMGG